jgi:transposase InsO family protein
MTCPSDRQKIVELVDEACSLGARKEKACAAVRISIRTFQRWTRGNEVRLDQRPIVKRGSPVNKLSEQERSNILDVCHRSEFADLPPSQIVPRLADSGVYLASESTLYAVLKAANELRHRGRAKARKARMKPTTHVAKKPCEVWTWDITWLPAQVKGLFFFLYLILDLHSRKIVGWEIFETESSLNAALVVKKAVLSENCIGRPLVLHSDNGSPMKGATFKETLKSLGIEPSYSRPRVSNDNPYSEAIFRTCKYRPDFPYKGFASLEKAREWVLSFVHWYNFIHRHSGIKFVTPHQRHTGQDVAILAARNELYENFRRLHPERWTGQIRNWNKIETVKLNPEKDSKVR